MENKYFSLKAAIYAGFTFGVIYSLINVIYYLMIFYGLPYVPDPLIQISINRSLIMISSRIIIGLLFGLIYGLLFSIFYSYMPGSKPIYNGLIVSIFIWLIFSFIAGRILNYYYFYSNIGTHYISCTIDLLLITILGIFYNRLIRDNFET